MRTITRTKQFKKDFKKLQKRGKNLDKLLKVVLTLQQQGELPPKNKPHILSGDWANFWECHIEPDWLMIYLIDELDLRLVRTGTHADLFK